MTKKEYNQILRDAKAELKQWEKDKKTERIRLAALGRKIRKATLDARKLAAELDLDLDLD
jgi:uncharacterized membrane protein